MGSNSSGLEVGADVVDSLSAEFRSSRAIIPRKRPSSSRREEEEEEGREKRKRERREIVNLHSTV